MSLIAIFGLWGQLLPSKAVTDGENARFHVSGADAVAPPFGWRCMGRSNRNLMVGRGICDGIDSSLKVIWDSLMLLRAIVNEVGRLDLLVTMAASSHICLAIWGGGGFIRLEGNAVFDSPNR